MYISLQLYVSGNLYAFINSRKIHELVVYTVPISKLYIKFGNLLSNVNISGDDRVHAGPPRGREQLGHFALGPTV